MKRLRENREGEGSRDVVEQEKEELTCPAVYPPMPLVFHPTILLTSCEFKQLSLCEVIPNALK